MAIERQQNLMEKQKEAFNRKADRTINYSILSISIAFTFLVLTLPTSIPLIANPIYHEPFPWFDGTYVRITNFLEVLNYSLNFFVYCMANSDIRNAAWKNIKLCTTWIRTCRDRLW